MRRSLLLVLAGALFPWALPAQATDLYAEDSLPRLKLTFAQKDWWTQLSNNWASKTYIPADLTLNGKIYKKVGVRFRGNSSYKAIGISKKKPFKISMDAYVPGQRLLGYRTVNLNNSFRDPSLTRELVSYWIYRQIMPAPRANYARLSINGEDWGVYLNIEQINKDLIRKWFRDDNGNRYRGERTSALTPTWKTGLVWLGSQSSAYQGSYQLKNSLPTSPWVDLVALCNSLNNSGARIATDLPKVLEVDEALRYLVGMSLLPAIDSYLSNSPHNFYLYFDPYHGKASIMPWDLNASFGGNNWLTVTQKKKLDIYYQANNVNLPLLGKVFAVPEWKGRYLAHYRDAIDRIYDWKVLGPKLAQYQKFIEKELRTDKKKLYSMQMFKDNIKKDVRITFNVWRRAWIPGMEPMIKERRAFLLAHADIKPRAPALSGLRHVPAIPKAGEKVTVLVQAGAGMSLLKLRYRERGDWLEAPLFDDGKHGDGKALDGLFGMQFQGMGWGTQIDYYVIAKDKLGNYRHAPAFGGHAPGSFRVQGLVGIAGPRINEFVALNTKGIQDENKEFEDWIEIANSTNQALDVGGMYLTDDLKFATRWKFPLGTKIPVGGHILVFADKDLKQGALHANFKLDKDGEEIAIFARDGKTLIDHVGFGSQVSDEAQGRLHDATLPWVHFAVPSPKARNGTLPCAARTFDRLDPWLSPVGLGLAGAAKLGTSPQLTLVGQTASSVSVLLISATGMRFEILDGSLSLMAGIPFLAALPFPSSSTGAQNLPLALPSAPNLDKVPVYFQVLSLDTNLRFLGSNGLEIRLCR